MKVYNIKIDEEQSEKLLQLITNFHNSYNKANTYANQITKAIDDGRNVSYPPRNSCIIRNQRGNIRVESTYIKIPSVKAIRINKQIAPSSTIGLVRVTMHTNMFATIEVWTVGELQRTFGSLLNWHSQALEI